MGIDLEAIIDVPDTLFDEPGNLTPGFYFGDVSRNNLKQYEKTLAKIVFGNPRLREKYGTVTSEGLLELNQPMCRNFLTEAALIRSLLGSLLHVATSGPYRGTEYTTTCIRNTVDGNSRNVKAILGKLCLVSGYNKTSSAVGLLYKLSYSPLPATNLHDRTKG
jgi:hypothetical protein